SQQDTISSRSTLTMAEIKPCRFYRCADSNFANSHHTTYKYGRTVKNAKKSSERIEGELKDVQNILVKLRDLVHGAEQSGCPLDYWPTLVSIKQKGGPLSECESALNC